MRNQVPMIQNQSINISVDFVEATNSNRLHQITKENPTYRALICAFSASSLNVIGGTYFLTFWKIANLFYSIYFER